MHDLLKQFGRRTAWRGAIAAVAVCAATAGALPFCTQSLAQAIEPAASPPTGTIQDHVMYYLNRSVLPRHRMADDDATDEPSDEDYLAALAALLKAAEAGYIVWEVDGKQLGIEQTMQMQRRLSKRALLAEARRLGWSPANPDGIRLHALMEYERRLDAAAVELGRPRQNPAHPRPGSQKPHGEAEPGHSTDPDDKQPALMREQVRLWQEREDATSALEQALARGDDEAFERAWTQRRQTNARLTELSQALALEEAAASSTFKAATPGPAFVAPAPEPVTHERPISALDQKTADDLDKLRPKQFGIDVNAYLQSVEKLKANELSMRDVPNGGNWWRSDPDLVALGPRVSQWESGVGLITPTPLTTHAVIAEDGSAIYARRVQVYSIQGDPRLRTSAYIDVFPLGDRYKGLSSRQLIEQPAIRLQLLSLTDPNLLVGSGVDLPAGPGRTTQRTARVAAETIATFIQNLGDDGASNTDVDSLWLNPWTGDPNDRFPRRLSDLNLEPSSRGLRLRGGADVRVGATQLPSPWWK